jgi:chemotaxis signal transduction protein
MPLADHTRTLHPQTFDFVLFRLGPFLFGVAAERVVRVRRRKMPDRDSHMHRVNLRRLLLPTADGQRDASEDLLEIETRFGRTLVSVDTAEGTLTLTLDQMRELPPLIDRHKRHGVLWGAAFLDKETLFLLDLDLLEPEDAV